MLRNKNITLALAALAASTLGIVSGANLAGATSTTTPTVTPTPIATSVACEEEDGSGDGQVLPCRWDAGSDGNGVGLSFTVSKNTAGWLCYSYDDAKADAKFGGCEKPVGYDADFHKPSKADKAALARAKRLSGMACHLEWHGSDGGWYEPICGTPTS